MAKHVYIKDIAAHLGEEVTLKGRLYNRTDKGAQFSWSGKALDISPWIK